MALKKIKFGELIELTNIKNSDNKYGIDDAIGVNMEKIIKPMRGNNNEKDFDKFHLVPPRHFAYNPRGGSKLGLGFNDTDRTYIITFNDNVFKIKDSAKNLLLEEYLYMYLCRKEWDRFAEYISWGSSTVVFDWKDFCDVEIELPDLPTQQKYVDVYLSMIENQKAYEKGLDDLKLVCDAYIEDLRRKTTSKKIGPYIEEIDERNKDNKVKLLQGFCMSGDFIEPRRISIDIPSLKILKNGELIYNRAVECVSDRFIVAIREGATCAVSNSYIIFKSKDESKLLNKYLLLWLKRTEFARYSKFKSHGTAHENFEFEDLCEVEIPIPSIDIQTSIVEILDCYSKRREINERLKNQIKDICPILIKGSISGK